MRIYTHYGEMRTILSILKNSVIISTSKAELNTVDFLTLFSYTWMDGSKIGVLE